MQYILTQSEYDALTPIKRLQERNEALEKAKGIILSLSDFTCIHEKSIAESKGRMRSYGGYCDDCPISFKKVGHESSKYICVLSKNYSK